MSERPAGDRLERIAYYHAAVGVVGHELSVPVLRLSTASVGHDVDPLPLVMPLHEWQPRLRRPADGGVALVEDYVTVLLAGSVGRVRLSESRRGLEVPSLWQRRLERRTRAAALAAEDAFTDRAWAIAVGWLAPSDGGDAFKTLTRLWRRASRLLLAPPHRSRLDRLAAELLAKGELFHPEIAAALGQ